MTTEKYDPFLAGKNVVVTGAGRGLGRALAIVAADHGANLILHGRDSEKLEEVAGAIKSRSRRNAVTVPCDLSDPGRVAEACKRTLADHAIIDVLVNNGAPWLEGKFEELSDEVIVSTVAAGVSGTMLVTKGLLPGLHRSRTADIVTIVSSAGIPGRDVEGGSVPFFAAKHGQSGFSDKLRYELEGTGIRVSAIYPPDFDDADPLDATWSSPLDDSIGLSNRDIVSLVLYILASPRSCSFPMVVVDGP